MRRAWLALPVLACVCACSPLKDYQDAARLLRFHLDRVEPSVHLALPLDRSRMGFRMVIGVDNPSQVPFHVLTFSGDLKLETRGAIQPIGRIELAKPLDLPAAGTGRMDAEVTFTYQELRDNWVAIQAAARGGSGVWHLEGTLKAEAFGLPLSFPVRTSRSFGGGE